MNELKSIERLRFNQIRFFSKTVVKIAQSPRAGAFRSLLGRIPSLDDLLFGFRRTFPSFEAANRYAAKYNVLSHEHPENIAEHARRAQFARPSDYPVLFYLQKLSCDLRSVLDIGGCVGNLFYAYSRCLQFPPDLQWTVFDLPETISEGRKIAAERPDARLGFVDRLEDCPAADAVVISGALHYMEALPPELMAGLKRQPRHLFINRAPVIDGPSAITLQDHEGRYALSAARILSRKVLLEAMAAANYELIDEWTVPELRLEIPLHPDASVSAYSGFYFRAKDIRAEDLPAVRRKPLPTAAPMAWVPPPVEFPDRPGISLRNPPPGKKLPPSGAPVH
jgi:putative methyltransferase (TIGR04325 family)